MAFHGVGFGFVYATAIGTAQQWFSKENRGLAGSIVIAGYGFGAVVWIPLQTSFVNPENIKAVMATNCTDVESSCDKYFIDQSVLDRVPYMFLVLAGVSSILGILAVLLISSPEIMNTSSSSTLAAQYTSSSSTLAAQYTSSTACIVELQLDRRLNVEENENAQKNRKKNEEEMEEKKEEEEKEEKKKVREEEKDEKEEKEEHGEKEKKENLEGDEQNLSPVQLLKTRTFYQLWLCFLGISLANGILQNYSKTFGFTFINDDHYFYKIGIVSNILNGFCRIVWGLLYDRLKFRRCYMIIGSVVTITTITMPVLPLIGTDTVGVHASYGIWMFCIFATFPGIYAIIAAALADYFGQKHYQANFGLLFTQNLGYCAIILIITKVPSIYNVFGYSGMFITSGVFSLIGLISAYFLPDL
ncbi:uncharacterized protein LOC111708833 [Eurytemora carolleeae]|uniref:uncharacterized protein LOC111708833 n=1 Tax=Eurytemora carolleeae TaxID=1294199 RepID=UPI000C777FD5|nr:uncharacterized protein LOC111708833 [Eurytemora carolleeae]|eukprot:XP_023338101.1 uncharacterized protein LOC111708833 [Eurytemora affinis]